MLNRGPINIPYRNFIILSLIIFFLFSCSDDENQFTIGQEFIDSKTTITMIDTFSVDLSTVVLDSVSTSDNNILFIGKYSDTLTGVISSSSFFQVGLPGTVNMLENDVYDSISLVIIYNGYSYGDTSVNFGLNIYELSESIILNDDGYLYNTSHFGYYESLLGSMEFYPRPNDVDTIVEIPLKDELGTDFFNKLMDDSEIFSTQDIFTDYFKGIHIKPHMNNESILGFKAEDGDIYIRLYSHRIGETLTDIVHDFPVYETEKQFNQVTANYTNTSLYDIENQKESVPSYKTNYLSYLQGGIGILTKVNFPSLAEVLLFDRGILTNAELVLYPEKTHYTPGSLSENLYMYSTDNINRFGDLLYDESGYTISSVLTLDELYREDTYYTFDLTNYIKDELSDSYVDSDMGILISFSPDEMYSSFEKILFTSNNPEAKLILYYLTY